MKKLRKENRVGELKDLLKTNKWVDFGPFLIKWTHKYEIKSGFYILCVHIL